MCRIGRCAYKAINCVESWNGDAKVWSSTTTSGVKRKIFVSYHHRGDQDYYDMLSRTFGGIYELLEDHSLDHEVDSDNAAYVMRVIRENFITGSSCTIVLCGAATYGRKHVDWEIKATLDAQHGLIGVRLPSLMASANGTYTVPERLHANVESGYALWTDWSSIIGSPASLTAQIEAARARPNTLIANSTPMRERNSS
jgi:hypothetical protein